jgi:hypothetical protein
MRECNVLYENMMRTMSGVVWFYGGQWFVWFTSDVVHRHVPWQRELAKRVTSIVIIAASRRFPPLPATKQQPQVTTEKRRGWNIEGLNGKKENCEGHSRRVLY